jgi:hypothetical protein
MTQPTSSTPSGATSAQLTSPLAQISDAALREAVASLRERQRPTHAKSLAYGWEDVVTSVNGKGRCQADLQHGWADIVDRLNAEARRLTGGGKRR